MARWSEAGGSGSRRIQRRAAVFGASLGTGATELIAERGYAVRHIAAIDELIAECSIAHFELVILAATIEENVDACRALRGTPAVHDTYVLAATPREARPADVDALLSVGANDLCSTEGPGLAALEAFDVRLRIADAWIQQRARRRRAESATRAQEAKFRAVFEGTRDAVLLIDDQGTVVDCNAAAAPLFGRRRDELLGVRLREVMAPNSLEHQSQPGASDPETAWARFLTRGEQNGAFRLVRADASWCDVEYQSRAAILPHLHLMVLRDVTESRRSRDQLIIADRLASLGAVASGIGHEINNPLATIAANVEYLQAIVGKTPTEEEKAEAQIALTDAREAVERLRGITTDLRAFSHLDELPRPLDVEQVVETAIRIAQHQLMRKARLVRDFNPVPRVQAAEGRLGHVVLHILLLAAHSIPSGAQRKNEIRVAVRLENGKVVIEVTDTGAGLPADAMPRTLDALASTPPSSQGASPRVGLWLVRSIVESLGGEIDIANAPTRGTNYRVALRAA